VGESQGKALEIVHPATGQHRTATPAYWDDIAREWCRGGDERVWRMVADSINGQLLKHWLQPNAAGSVLKTDLFDEVVGTGLVPWLSKSFTRVAAIDVSPVVVELARERCPGIEAETADARELPFRDESFDTVVSNSTLDHFPTRDDIARALGEFRRVLQPGGTLLVTLDNPINPVVALRNALPERVRTASGMVPFAVGATCGPRRLRSVLERTGFKVTRMGAVFHCPRVLVVLGGHLIDRHCGASAKRRYVRLWTAFEGLSSLPTRFLTGYFVAALARKA
jgi:SAM-dependent methyltransferase